MHAYNTLDELLSLRLRPTLLELRIVSSELFPHPQAISVMETAAPTAMRSAAVAALAVRRIAVVLFVTSCLPQRVDQLGSDGTVEYSL